MTLFPVPLLLPGWGVMRQELWITDAETAGDAYEELMVIPFAKL